MKRTNKKISPRSLIKDTKKYRGKYVALKSFSSHKVVSAGPNPLIVSQKAQQQGIKKPVIFHVPKKSVTNIY